MSKKWNFPLFSQLHCPLNRWHAIAFEGFEFKPVYLILNLYFMIIKAKIMKRGAIPHISFISRD